MQEFARKLLFLRNITKSCVPTHEIGMVVVFQLLQILYTSRVDPERKTGPPRMEQGICLEHSLMILIVYRCNYKFIFYFFIIF